MIGHQIIEYRKNDQNRVNRFVDPLRKNYSKESRRFKKSSPIIMIDHQILDRKNYQYRYKNHKSNRGKNYQNWRHRSRIELHEMDREKNHPKNCHQYL